MKFLTIPKNGASWQQPLVYAVELGASDGSDAHVEIVDADNSSIASFNVYGKSSFEVDISPYIRDIADVAPVTSKIALSRSNAAYKIVVRVNGVSSETRIYYREELDVETPTILSCVKERAVVSSHDTIRLTIYAKKTVSITIHKIRKVVMSRSFHIMTNGLPVELVFPLSQEEDDITSVNIKIVMDELHTHDLSYRVIQQVCKGVQTVWYNTMGGVESYTFPRCKLISCEAVMKRGRDGQERVAGKEYLYTLYSAYEVADELARIGQIPFADNLYVDKGGTCHSVQLVTRKIDLGDTPGGKNLQIEVKSRKKLK